MDFPKRELDKFRFHFLLRSRCTLYKDEVARMYSNDPDNNVARMNVFFNIGITAVCLI